MKQKGFAPILIVIILAAVLMAGGYFYYQNQAKSTQIACTQEAKLCPDGSYVGRSGPKCEFAKCPTTESTPSADTSNWKTYTNSKLKYFIKYPVNWSLVEQLEGESVDIYDQPNVIQPQLHDGTWITISSSGKWDGPQIGDPVGTSLQPVEGVLRKKVLDIQLSGSRATKIIQTVSQSPTNARPTIFIISEQNDQLIIISFSSISQEQLNKDTRVFDQILSTFKFLPKITS